MALLHLFKMELAKEITWENLQCSREVKKCLLHKTAKVMPKDSKSCYGNNPGFGGKEAERSASEGSQQRLRACGISLDGGFFY